MPDPQPWPRSLSLIVPPHSEGFGLGGKLAVPDYLARLTDHLAAAERVGVTGAFVYDFPVAMDPWLAAFDVLACSNLLQPIVAVRPHQESVESVARRAVDLHYRFGRPTHLNLVAGATSPSRPAADLADRQAARQRLAGFASELRTELDRRQSIGPLLFTPSSSTPGLVPVDCVLLMARPRPALAAEVARIRAEQQVDRVAMLVGLLVRPTTELAWQASRTLYPPDRRQQVAGRLFRSQVVSSEHLASYALADQQEVHDELLWYGAPARGIDAPKLVGSPVEVSDWLVSCRELGVTDLIIDLAPDPAEYDCLGQLFESGR
ncbi:MAG TPA: hypothetical protein VH298_11925 [Jatrophihabitans sp.]|nr:hypothetical protein [Jatrophihabitans sp.]